MRIKESDLKFKPLDHAPWINNAIVQVTDRFNLSISYCPNGGLWHVGEKGSYEVAIQASDPEHLPQRDLISLKDNKQVNIYSGCDIHKINLLIQKAAKLKYVGKIMVFDIISGKEQPDWHPRFFCAEGYDLEEKIKYAKQIWKSKYKFIPSHI